MNDNLQIMADCNYEHKTHNHNLVTVFCLCMTLSLKTDRHKVEYSRPNCQLWAKGFHKIEKDKILNILSKTLLLVV